MDNQEQALVTLNDLTYCRQGRAVLNQLNIRIPRGKITAIMGPSGAGKTTILRLIGAQLTPDEGTVMVDGQDIHQLSKKQCFLARQKMGFLFQSAALFTNISVFENVAFPLREHTNLPESMIRDVVLMKLQAVGLRGARDLMPHELSGGMARRVALARAIALDPQLILYDEPFAGQDPISMGVLMKLMKILNHSLGLTSVIVSHDVQETASIADYVYLLADGRITGEGTAEEMLQNQSPQVKQFMQGLADGVVPFHYPANPYAEDLLL